MKLRVGALNTNSWEGGSEFLCNVDDLPIVLLLRQSETITPGKTLVIKVHCKNEENIWLKTVSGYFHCWSTLDLHSDSPPAVMDCLPQCRSRKGCVVSQVSMTFPLKRRLWIPMNKDLLYWSSLGEIACHSKGSRREEPRVDQAAHHCFLPTPVSI